MKKLILGLILAASLMSCSGQYGVSTGMSMVRDQEQSIVLAINVYSEVNFSTTESISLETLEEFWNENSKYLKDIPKSAIKIRIEGDVLLMEIPKKEEE